MTDFWRLIVEKNTEIPIDSSRTSSSWFPFLTGPFMTPPAGGHRATYLGGVWFWLSQLKFQHSDNYRSKVSLIWQVNNSLKHVSEHISGNKQAVPWRECRFIFDQCSSLTVWSELHEPYWHRALRGSMIALAISTTASGAATLPDRRAATH